MKTYLHAYHHGRHIRCQVYRTFQAAERAERERLRLHGRRGWSYELATTARDPVNTCDHHEPAETQQ